VGPCAPADRRAPALGEGGGNTTRSCCWWCVFAVGWDVLASSSADSVPPSSPDCSLGMCTFSLGRLASVCAVFDLVGAAGMLAVLDARCGGCGDLIIRFGGGRGGAPFSLPAFCFSRCIAAMSTDADRGPPSSLMAGSIFEASMLLVAPQCCANIDLVSSMGVKMLCALFAGSGLGCGIGGLANSR